MPRFFFPLFISYPPLPPPPIFSSPHLTLTRPSFPYTLPPPSSPSSYPATPYFLAVGTAAWYSQQTDVPSAKHGGEQKHSTIDWYIVVHMQHALHASRDVTTLPVTALIRASWRLVLALDLTCCQQFYMVQYSTQTGETGL